MLEFNSPIVQSALHAVNQASELVRQVQAELAATTLTKDDRSPVTVADFASQAWVAHFLEKAFPEDVLVAEETSQALLDPDKQPLLQQVCDYVSRFAGHAESDQVCAWIDRGAGNAEGRYWVLDPIDGTKGFLRGGQYVVALALIDAGKVELGVLGCPNLEDGAYEKYGGVGSLVVAQRDRGAWVTTLGSQSGYTAYQPEAFQRLRVSSRQSFTDARLLRSFERAHTNTQIIDMLMAQLGIRAQALRLDSQAKYALLAAGGGEIMIRLPPEENPGYKEKIWDQAAGALIVEEAGGRISDLSGQPLDFTWGRTLQRNRGVLATNGLLHEPLLNKLAQVAS